MLAFSFRMFEYNRLIKESLLKENKINFVTLFDIK